MKTKQGVVFQIKLHPLHYKGSSNVKIVNSFILFEMHYNWTFAKIVYDFEFQPWKTQPTSFGNFDPTFVIVSVFHDPWLKKTLVKKNNNKLNYQQTTLMQKLQHLEKH